MRAGLAILAGVALLAGGLPAGAAELRPGEPVPARDLERFVDGAVADAMAADHIAGVSVAIVQGGRAVLLKGYGMAGPGRAVDPQRTLFRLGSISKTFTWITVMQAVERGRLRLDEPVNEGLPPALHIPDEGFAESIRLRDLMSHSAGFEDIQYGHLTLEQADRLIPLASYLAQHRPHRVRPPGRLASYSNYGAALAGYMAARQAGLPFETLVERDVLAPLGLVGTSFREPHPLRADLPAPMPPDLAARLSQGFIWGRSGLRPHAFEYEGQIAPAGSASSTAADMARYMRLLLAGGVLDGTRIYGADAARAFRTPLLQVPEGVNGWAHGFMVRTLPGGHAGYGHGGSMDAFYSNLVVVPDLDLGVFVAANTNTGRPLVDRLPGLVVGRFYADPPPFAAPPRPAGPDVYSGTWLSTRRAYSGLEGFLGRMAGGVEVARLADGDLVTHVGGQVQAWNATATPGRFLSADGTQALAFAFDRAGRAVRAPWPRGTLSLERVGPIDGPPVFRFSALAAATAAAGLWIAAIARLGRSLAATPWQARAARLGLATATLWLAAFAVYLLGPARASEAALMRDWPNPGAVAASALALAASAGSVGTLAITPLLFPRGAGGWGPLRQAGHLLGALAFCAFAVVVGAWGGLAPWS